MVRCCLLILRSTGKTLQHWYKKKDFFLKLNIYLTNKQTDEVGVGETMWITAIPSSAEKTFTDSRRTCCSLAVTPTDRRCVSPYGAFKLYMVSPVYTVYVFALAEQGSAIVYICALRSVNQGVAVLEPPPVKPSPSLCPTPLFAMSIFGMLMCFVLTMHGC